jgi:hypothetical protein
MQQSASLRPILAYIAWEMFKDYPLTGVGLGQYKNVDKYYLNDRSTGFVVENVRPYHQHNVVLSLLTETGLLGTFLFIAMFAGWLRSAYRLWCQADLPLYYRQVGLLFLTLFAAYFANGMFQDVTIVPMVHMTLFFFAGVTMGLYLQYAKPAERAESRRNRLATWKHRRFTSSSRNGTNCLASSATYLARCGPCCGSARDRLDTCATVADRTIFDTLGPVRRTIFRGDFAIASLSNCFQESGTPACRVRQEPHPQALPPFSRLEWRVSGIQRRQVCGTAKSTE